MKGHWITYSAAELQWIEAHAQEPREATLAAFCKRFKRSDVSLSNFNALCKRKGWLTGRRGYFPKGNVPHNKGTRCAPGTGGRHPNARKTQFKKGALPHNTNYAGHERVTQDGYIEISVNQTNPYTGFERRYVLKHRWLWEQKNGPLPKGHCLKCLDGNRQNVEPSNWEAIPRGVNARLSGRNGLPYDSAPDELKPAILATAKLKHATRSKRERIAKEQAHEE